MSNSRRINRPLLEDLNAEEYIPQDPRRVIVQQLVMLESDYDKESDNGHYIHINIGSGTITDSFDLYKENSWYTKLNKKTKQVTYYSNTTDIANSINETISDVMIVYSRGGGSRSVDILWSVDSYTEMNPQILLKDLLKDLPVEHNNVLYVLKVIPVEPQPEYALAKRSNNEIAATYNERGASILLNIYDTIDLFNSYKSIKLVRIDSEVPSLVYQQFLWDNPYEPFIINQNPSQLKVVDSPTEVPSITGKSYPGQCVICTEPIVGEGCRVNCEAGHIFHCDCINGWRNTQKTNTYYNHGWQNNCPICRDPISKMYHVQITPEIQKSTEFGKRRVINKAWNISEINKAMKYLKSL